MKAKRLTREQTQSLDLTQTAIIVTGTRVDKPGAVITRIIVGEFPDRDTAYYYCRDNNIRRMMREGKVKGSLWQVEVKLLRLKKALRDINSVKCDTEYWLIKQTK